MLCRKCWTQEASVHFRYVCGGEVHHIAYCLACAQDEPWSWLLAWAHGRALATYGLFPTPVVVRARDPRRGRLRPPYTLLATGLHRCACGCRIAVGAEVACNHAAYTYQGNAQLVDHVCHCGREHTIVLPHVVCRHCSASEGHPIIATAQTCLWDHQRRHLVGVNEDLHCGRPTWGTFAIRN